MNTDEAQQGHTRPKAGFWLVWLSAAGIVVVIVLSIILGARVGLVVLGAELIALAALRALTPWADQIAARSRLFDVICLGGLGAAMTVVALTADNI